MFSAAVVGIAQIPCAVAAAELWDDRPLKIIQTSQSNFPAALLSQGVTEGQVRAVLHIDADGKFQDCLVTGYTHRELVPELLAGVREWNFEAARQRGERIGTRAEAMFAFHARGAVLSLTSIDALASGPNRLFAAEMISLLCRAADLDEPLRAIHTVAPHHPGRSVPQPPAQPTAVIDFYVDSEGRPRMPVVLRASHELYAIAAIEALLQWRFTPPRQGGLPRLVRATQAFAFTERT